MIEFTYRELAHNYRCIYPYPANKAFYISVNDSYGSQNVNDAEKSLYPFGEALKGYIAVMG